MSFIKKVYSYIFFLFLMFFINYQVQGESKFVCSHFNQCTFNIDLFTSKGKRLGNLTIFGENSSVKDGQIQMFVDMPNKSANCMLDFDVSFSRHYFPVKKMKIKNAMFSFDAFDEKKMLNYEINNEVIRKYYSLDSIEVNSLKCEEEILTQVSLDSVCQSFESNLFVDYGLTQKDKESFEKFRSNYQLLDCDGLDGHILRSSEDAINVDGMSVNQWIHLFLPLFPKTISLSANNSNITHLGRLEQLSQLQEINLSHNPLVSISSDFFKNKYSLRDLNLSFTNVQEIAINKKAGIFFKNINISHTPMTSLSFMQNVSNDGGFDPIELNASSTKINSLKGIEGIYNISKLNIANTLVNDLHELKSSLHRLAELDISDTKIDNFDEFVNENQSLFSELKVLNSKNISFERLNFLSYFYRLRELNISGSYIRDPYSFILIGSRDFACGSLADLNVEKVRIHGIDSDFYKNCSLLEKFNIAHTGLVIDSIVYSQISKLYFLQELKIDRSQFAQLQEVKSTSTFNRLNQNFFSRVKIIVIE